MMKIIKSSRYFAILFLFLLLVDVYIKTHLENVPYRYISKFAVIISLLFYYNINKKHNSFKYQAITIGLCFFLLGDLVIINYFETVFFVIAMISFVIGKIMYCIKFSNNRDFNLIRLLPFSFFSFLLMVLILMLVINKLGNFFIPVLLYFFVSLLMFLFAYLRKNDVNKMSYYLVFLGMFSFLISEIVMVLKTFYIHIPYNQTVIMLSYGVAQYLIVLGIINERKQPNFYET